MINVIYDATVVTNTFYKDGNRTGIFFAAWNILNELVKRQDVHVTLYFSPETIADGEKLRDSCYPGCDCLQNVTKYKNLRSIYRKCRKLYAESGKRKLKRLLLAFPLGILYVFFLLTLKPNKEKLKRNQVYFSPFFKIPKFVRKYNGLKPFVFVYDFIPLVLPQYYPKWKAFVVRVMDNYKEGDFFFFDSENTRKDAVRFFPEIVKENAAVALLAAGKCFKPKKELALGAKIRNKYNIPSGKKYVFSLCSLEPRKNVVRIVRSFLKFIEKNKVDDLVLLVGGAVWTSFEKILEKESIKWNKEQVVQTGYIDDDDLSILYSNAEWFVYTSQYEGFGLPPLEAMQCGCPVITSNNSSLPEVVGDAGLMIDWESDKQHVDAYEKYYFDDEIRKENGKKGLERAYAFSWHKSVAKMVRVMGGEGIC